MSALVSALPIPSVKSKGRVYTAPAGPSAPAAYQIWRLPQVEQVTGHKKSFLYERMARGEFPKPIPTGSRAKGWLALEVVAWIESRTALRS